MDEIAITGIRGFGNHGLFEDEKKNGQEFIVDIRMEKDLSLAGSTDQIDATIDYGKVAVRVKELIESDSFNLIERLAEVIADQIKSEFSVTSIEVTVHKPHAPVEIEFDDISVTIKR
jgi:dihydroneopterin aldolase